MTRSLRILALLTIALAGCKDGGGDASRDGSPMEAGALDGGTDTDATNGDGDVVDEDGNVVDQDGDVEAGTTDGGVIVPDAGPVLGGTPTCVSQDLAIPCVGGDCDEGYTCITSACGASICARPGRICFDEGDCPSQSDCMALGDENVCRPTNAEVCNDARDCPPGFECEGASGSRVCRSRRVPCANEEACPSGYLCTSPTMGDARFCVYLPVPCGVDKGCRSSDCRDVDGDGDTECAVSNADGLLCELPSGTCASGDCRDTHGADQGFCTPDGSGCTGPGDCGTHGLCLVTTPGMPPTCVEGF